MKPTKKKKVAPLFRSQKMVRSPRVAGKEQRSTSGNGPARNINAELEEVIEVDGSDDDVADDFDSHKEVSYQLIKPTGKISKFWDYYLVYHPKHKDKKDIAVCKDPHCRIEINISKGTAGLGRHLQHRHRETYDDVVVNGAKNQSSGSAL